MATEIRVPTLGESITSATVARWLKQPGEAVLADEPLVELETDKVTVEVNAPVSGVLTAISVPEGTEVEVGAMLGVVDPAGTQTVAGPAAIPTAGVYPPPRALGPVSRPAAPPTAPQSSTQTAVAQAAAQTAPAQSALAQTVPAQAAPAQPALAQTAQARATEPVAAVHAPLPAAAKMIEERHLDTDAIGAGTGKDGRITKGDVLEFLNRPPAPPRPPAAPAAPRVPDAREERVRMTRLRRTIAARLKEAQNTAAMLTTFNEVDMSAVMALRSEYRDAFEKKHAGVRLGFMSFFVKACVTALQEFPAVNAEVDGEDIVYKHFVHMGIAVGGPGGLVVPVVRDADRMSFAEIEKAIADFGRRARDGALKLEELTGGTFSITNGGIYGSLMSTPILNPPQSAILGMHKIQERPIVAGGKIAIRPMMYLAVSYDHRIVDGKEAVSFLVRVKEGVEDPRRLLLDL